jgi:CubicO group peptidase (beta-lactamase class C family)
MQPVSNVEFLHNVGYGAIILPLEGRLALAPLVDPSKLPPVANATAGFGSVDAQAQALLNWYNLPGIVIGLIRDNKLVYARGFGLQSIQPGRPMTENSVMAIASLSKMFTGTAVMQLVESGCLTLDDQIARFIPYFHMADPRYREITVRHLLSHTSGLPEWTEESFRKHLDHPWEEEDALERLVRSLDGGTMLSQDPGAKDASFGYGFMGYCLLGALIQEITDEPFEHYQRHHILDPLHMFRSTFLMSEVRKHNLAAAHIHDIPGKLVAYKNYPCARQLAPAAYLFTSVVELSHFIMATIDQGFYHRRILEAETQALMWTPLYTAPYGWVGTGYNSGVFITSYVESGREPIRMILSMGAIPGVNSHITIFPEQRIAAIVLINLNTTAENPCYSWGICDKLAIQLLHGEL